MSKGWLLVAVLSGISLMWAIWFGDQPIPPYDDSWVCYPTRCFRPMSPGMGAFILWSGGSAGIFIGSFIALIFGDRP